MGKLPLERLTATHIVKRRDWQAVSYQGTEVVGWDEDRIVLRSGGWQTVTTKRRINQAAQRWLLGFHLYQVRGDWLIRFDGEEPIRFYDGIILSRDRTQPHPKERAHPGDQEYNGWPNRATWNAFLWLNNTESHYRAYTAQARRQRFTARSAARFTAQRFGYPSLWNARTPDGEPLHRVHWDRIAEAMNEGIEE